MTDTNQNKAVGKYDDSQEWRKELASLMITWHFSIQKIEQFVIRTIESEILKARGK